jgi:para-nitrobenzyl esterase
MKVTMLAAAIALAIGGSATAREGGSPVIMTDSGPVRGATSADLRVFKGIPFAAAPIGPLRWRTAQPVAAWSNVRPATAYGASCMQVAKPPVQPPPMIPVPAEAAISEDCLFLNVWAPARAKRLPVLVSIHGGGLFMGSGSWEAGDPSNLAQQGFVAVTINYRLGVFGFFGHPELSAQSGAEPATNFGILDQIAALKWVRRNIAAFGGDPERVTIFGGSAGGWSVNTLMHSPLSAGLFQRAIATSATPAVGAERPTLTQPSGRNPSGEQWGLQFATKLGARSLAELRQVPAENVLEASLMKLPAAGISIPLSPGILADGKSVLMGDVEAFRAGRQHRVSYMNGADDYETIVSGGVPPWPEIEQRLGARKEAVLKAYDPESKLKANEVRIMIATDLRLLKPSGDLARDMRTVGLPGYTYAFAYVPKSVQPLIAGSWHAAEYPYVNGNLGSRSLAHGAATAEDQAISRSIQSYWLNFARTGNPGRVGGPEWQPAAEGTMVFTNDGPKFTRDYPGQRLSTFGGVLDGAD